MCVEAKALEEGMEFGNPKVGLTTLQLRLIGDISDLPTARQRRYIPYSTAYSERVYWLSPTASQRAETC